MERCPVCNTSLVELREEEVLRRIELISLSEMCSLIGMVLDRDAVLDMLTHMAPEIAEADEGLIILFSSDEKELILSFVSSRNPGDQSGSPATPVRMPHENHMAVSDIREGKAILIAAGDDAVPLKSFIEAATGWRIRNFLCVPIKVRERVIGALAAINKKDGRDFDRIDLRLCEAVASQAGVAIERTGLMEENLRTARLAAVGETTAGIAHCVRNILSGLKGGEQIVNGALDRGDQALMREGWKIVATGVDRISSLVLDMLAFVRDDRPDYSEVDPSRLIISVIDVMKELARRNGVEIEFDPGRESLPVIIDEKGIFRCVLNLVKNAIDACSNKVGRIRIELLYDSSPFFTIRISDTGCGMDADTQSRIFKSFFTTKGSNGTGLGLSVVDRIVRNHGGKIALESAPGKGATFSLQLPINGKQS